MTNTLKEYGYAVLFGLVISIPFIIEIIKEVI